MEVWKPCCCLLQEVHRTCYIKFSRLKKGARAATTSITNMSELERLIFHALHHQNRQKAGGEDVPLNVMPL